MSILEAATRGDYKALHVTLASLSADEVAIAVAEKDQVSSLVVVVILVLFIIFIAIVWHALIHPSTFWVNLIVL